MIQIHTNTDLYLSLSAWHLTDQFLSNMSVTAYGLTAMVAGKLVKPSITVFGERGHTSVMSILTTAGE